MSAPLSRRALLELGAFAVAPVVLTPAPAESAPSDGATASGESVVRAYYKAWEKKDWAPFDRILDNDFTFSSPHGDDHISKVVFKKRCWDTQIDYISHFDVELIMSRGNKTFVEYVCHTKNGKSFQNVELHEVRNGKIASITCFFGGDFTFASAVGSQND